MSRHGSVVRNAINSSIMTQEPDAIQRAIDKKIILNSQKRPKGLSLLSPMSPVSQMADMPFKNVSSPFDSNFDGLSIIANHKGTLLLGNPFEKFCEA